MKIATWNINGIKARHERLLSWIDRKRPDALCLQEIKTEDAGFPVEPYKALGYHVVTFGQKAYNGVAILSSTEPQDVTRGMEDGADDPQSRVIAATVAGVRVVSVYVPNGEAVGSEKYAYKLAWLARMKAYLSSRIKPGSKWAVCGDYNVAPADIDVHDPAGWEGQVLCSQPERDGLNGLLSTGLIDVVRKVHPDKQVFTWWDYRALGFPKNKGLRIDHLLCTEPVAKATRSAEVDREERKGKQASDHAPVMIDVDL